jgi:hypothetical protein
MAAEEKACACLVIANSAKEGPVWCRTLWPFLTARQDAGPHHHEPAQMNRPGPGRRLSISQTQATPATPQMKELLGGGGGGGKQQPPFLNNDRQGWPVKEARARVFKS